MTHRAMDEVFDFSLLRGEWAEIRNVLEALSSPLAQRIPDYRWPTQPVEATWAGRQATLRRQVYDWSTKATVYWPLADLHALGRALAGHPAWVSAIQSRLAGAARAATVEIEERLADVGGRRGFGVAADDPWLEAQAEMISRAIRRLIASGGAP